jgi:uncharacterized protein YndB with AHSA1/START domain
MAPIAESVEIARPPEEVFAYVTDPAHLSEWQERLVSARLEGDGPVQAGSRMITVRHVGGRDRRMTMEMTEFSPPQRWTVRGIDGPVRGIVHGVVEPTGDGARSRVTMELDFQAHGLGVLIVPLIVRRQAKSELPRATEKLKELLESAAA